MKKKVFLMCCIVTGLLITGCGNEKNNVAGSSSVSQTSSSGETNQTVQESSSSAVQNEGTPSTEKIDVDENREFMVGDTVQLKEDGKLQYELTINSVSYTDGRDEYTPDPGYVVLVNYTYKNVAEEALLIDDMRFQLMKPDESVLYESYYYPDVIAADVVDKGESCTAEVAYSMGEKQDELVLTYRDTVSETIAPFKVIINLA